MTALVGNVIAACFALAAFAVAVVAGLFGGIDAGSILFRAVIALVACYPLGLVIGMVCQHVVEEHLSLQEQPQPATETSDVTIVEPEQVVQSAEEAGQ